MQHSLPESCCTSPEVTLLNQSVPYHSKSLEFMELFVLGWLACSWVWDYLLGHGQLSTLDFFFFTCTLFVGKGEAVAWWRKHGLRPTEQGCLSESSDCLQILTSSIPAALLSPWPRPYLIFYIIFDTSSIFSHLCPIDLPPP